MGYQPFPPTGFTTDSNNSTTTSIGVGGSFIGVATDVSSSAQVNVTIYGNPSNAQGSLFCEFSANGTSWLISIPSLVRNPSLAIPLPLIPVDKFFRLRYLNDGGAAAIAALGLSDVVTTPIAFSGVNIRTSLSNYPTKELVRTLDQGIQGSDPVTLVRSVSMTKSPDGTYVNSVDTGFVAATNTPLAANGVYATPWIPYDSFDSIAMSVIANQLSAVNGLSIESSADGGLTTLPFISESYTGINQFKIRIVPAVRGTHFRVIYINGAVAQTVFSLTVRLNNYSSSGAVTSLWSNTDSGATAQNVKSMIKLPSSNVVNSPFDFITRTANSMNVNVTNTPAVTQVTPVPQVTANVWSGPQAFLLNKHMLTLYNNSAQIAYVHKITLSNLQLTSVSGVSVRFDISRFTVAPVGGVASVVSLNDTADTIPAGFAATSGSTIAALGNTLLSYVSSNDEVNGLNSYARNTLEVGMTLTPNIWAAKLLTLRPGQGVTIQNVTSTTLGSFGVNAVVTFD